MYLNKKKIHLQLKLSNNFQKNKNHIMLPNTWRKNQETKYIYKRNIFENDNFYKYRRNDRS